VPRSDASCAEGSDAARQPHGAAPRWVTALALLAFVALTGALVAWRGVFLTRDWLFLWALSALTVLSLGDLRRGTRGIVFDWLPLMALLLVYDLSNGAREFVGVQPHTQPQLQADLLAPGASVPTVELQQALYTTRAPAPYDYLAFALYLTHFFVTLGVLVALWRFSSRQRFRRFRAIVVTLATAGFVTYVLFPAVPPWLAAANGDLAPVRRIVGEMWPHVGLAPASALFERHQSFHNEVGALPSLHAAYPVALLAFFWAAGRWVRAGLGLYALAMGATLVYTGEHYVSDILVGWAYAGASVAAVALVARRRGRVQQPTSRAAYEPATQPVRAG
jgi:membrane-associated phospholipid phosphatase